MGLKLSSFSALEKYIFQGSLFCVALPYDEERKKLLYQCASLRKEAKLIYVDASSTPPENLLEILEQTSLFGEEVILIDHLDKAQKEIKEHVLAYKSLSKKIVVIGVSHLKGLGPLDAYYVLDLEGEKPWERKERMLQELSNQLDKRGKTLSNDALTVLIDRIGVDPVLLEQEIEKCLSLVGDRKEITLEDINSIVFTSQLQSGWECAQRLVWGEEPRGFFLSCVLGFDAQALSQLIGQVRYQLQLGLLLLEGGEEVLSTYFPQVRKTFIESSLPIAQRLGASLFRQRLLAVNKLEFESRSQSYLEFSFHWDLFIGRWQ